MLTEAFRKFAQAGAACIALTCGGAAVAADFPARPVIVAAAAPSWAGLYLGGNIGYGWDSGSVVFPLSATDPLLAPFVAAATAAGLFPASLSPSAHGVIGGVQIGYNWQPSSRWVVGLEADLQASGIKGSANQTTAAQFFDPTATGVTKSIGWFGTVRGRVGFLIDPQWLIYATGGLAYGETKLGFNTIDIPSGCVVGGTICADGRSSAVRAGWTVGAGVEAMLTPNWSFKLEYLYVDLGRRTVDMPASTAPLIFSTAAGFREQIVRVGFNYHFN